MSITTNLLETLLSPLTEQHRQAETCLQSLSLAERCSGFCHVLSVDSQVPHALQHLAAVLLRRDILQITELALLQDHLSSLMIFFSKWTSSNESKERTTIRSALGECLAQVVGSLLHLTFGQESHNLPTVALESIICELRPLACQADLVSLKILVRLAESVPVSFTQVSSELIPLIVSDASQRISVNPKKVELVTALIELVVAAGVASVATRSSSFSLIYDGVNNNEIDPQSVACQLGVTCFHRLRLLEYLLEVLSADSSSVSDNDDQALQHLIYAAERVPSLLAGTIDCFVTTMENCFSIASQSEEPTLRVMRALNVLVTLIQVHDVKSWFGSPPLLDHFLKSIIPFLVGSLGASDIANCEEEEWALRPAKLSEDLPDGFFAIALYAKDLLEGTVMQFPEYSTQILQPKMQRYLQPTNNIDFAQICAGLQGLQSCLQTIKLSFKQHALSSFNSALYWLEATLPMDSLPSGVRVQYHSLLVLGLACECYGHDESEINHTTVTNPQRVWRVLLQASQSRHTKIAALACDTMVIYCRSLPGTLNDVDKLLRPFLSDIVNALLSGPLLQDLDQNVGRMVVKIRAIEVLACLAQTCAPFFFPFYPTIMPGLITQASMTVSGFRAYEQSQLKGAAIEAATTIGMSLVEVDKKKGLRLFINDAHTLMHLAVNILKETTSVNDDIVAGMPIRQLLSSCSNIASALKKKYDPYMQTVMPHLLQRAANLTGVDFSEADETAEASKTMKEIEMGDDETESSTVVISGRGLTKVSLSSSIFEYKIAAIRGIFQHTALRELFVPYVELSLNTLLESVRFHYSVEVRSISTSTLEAVYITACVFDQSTDLSMLSTYFPLIIKAMTDQIIKDDNSSRDATCLSAQILSHILRNANSVQSCYKSALLRNFKLEDSRALVQLCMKALISCVKRRKQLLKNFSELGIRKTWEILNGFSSTVESDEWYFKLSTIESGLFTSLVDSIGFNIKLFKTDLLPIFEEMVAPTIIPFMSTACNDTKAHLGAIYLFDDCVELCGAEAAAQYAPLLAAAVVHGITNPNSNIDEDEADFERACIYGVAQIARYAPNDVLLPFSNSILPKLFAISKESKTSKNARIIEITISALASLVLFGNAPLRSTNKLNVDQVVTIFLKNLPLQEYRNEAKICSLGLCELVEQGVISAKNKYRELIRIIGETLAFVDALSNEIYERFLKILVYLQKEIPLNKQDQAMAQLSQKGQHEIRTLLQRHALAQAKYGCSIFDMMRMVAASAVLNEK